MKINIINGDTALITLEKVKQGDIFSFCDDPMEFILKTDENKYVYLDGGLLWAINECEKDRPVKIIPPEAISFTVDMSKV